MPTELDKKLHGVSAITGLPLTPTGLGPLKDRFTWEPFSWWDTKHGAWQDRRTKWRALGIQSEVGRGEDLTYKIPETLSDGAKGRKVEAGTSIFDPVVCELAYTWFCPPGGVVHDPFAGGSVRGIVASVLGLKYYGVELRGEQVTANKAQLVPGLTQGKYAPKWIEGDSRVVQPAHPVDFIFSCPPYGPLERYSDDPQDLSTLAYSEDGFLDAYYAIIQRACANLKDDSYAVWVVGNFRDPKTGYMHDFVGDTVRIFRRSGLRLYNDIVLLNPPGSGPMRSQGTFIRGHRKMVKLHQNVLVFVKGSPEKAGQKIPEIWPELSV